MTSSTILLNTPVVFQIPSDSVEQSTFENCNLTWNEEVLKVLPSCHEIDVRIPALKNESWLRECLTRSPVRKVYLDPTLEESVIKSWISICDATQKQVFLKTPSMPDLPQDKRPQLWQIKRLADWLAAAVLLLLLSPLMALLAVFIRLDSPGPILFRQWRVGHYGQLFQIYKFRSMQVDAATRHHEVMGNQVGLHKLKQDPRITPVGNWLRQLSLDELPQLFNVLKGEMSLVGPRPWAIYDAIRIDSVLQVRLQTLPGMTGPWQVSTRANELDLYAVTCRDLAYLQNWSLLKDLKILFLTFPKVFFGKGAY